MTVVKLDERAQFSDKPTGLLDSRLGERSPLRLTPSAYISDDQPEERLINSVSHSLERAIAKYLAEVEEAIAAYFWIEGDDIDIWTVLSDCAKATRYKVYDQERRIIRALPEFSLSFRTTNLQGAMAPQSVSYTKVDLAQVRRHA